VPSKPSNAVRPAANLKLTTHANLVLPGATYDADLVASLLARLNARSTHPLDTPALEAHRDELNRRAAGGRSLREVAEQEGVELGWLQTMPTLFKHFRFGRFEMDDIVVSLDLFNPANELQLPYPQEQLTLELFYVTGRRIEPFVNLVRTLVDEWPISFVFGGRDVFTACFVNGFRYSSTPLEASARPTSFLWPLTFLATPADGNVPATLPVHTLDRRKRGVLIQVFETLSTGIEDDYADAAHAMGVRSPWELKFPEMPPRPGHERAKKRRS
jgi:hypothetical protein